MCGIAGFSGNYPEFLLERMSASISHRGPDGMGTYYSGDKKLGMAHRRLSIIDLSESGQQPMWDCSGQVLITYNGEIYNYRELKEELIQKGFRFKSQSDTEVILNLYLNEGTQFLSRLNGIFAFALWDTRVDNLLLARDGVGVKPLYYSTTPKGFLFGSEIKAILQAPEVERSLSMKSINFYLSYLWSPAPDTILKKVSKLEPGCALLVREGEIFKSWSFYDLPYYGEEKDMDEQDAVKEVQDRVSEAVQKQMVADVPVGAFLSGGLDSSSVVNFARHHTGGTRLQCFTIGFRDDAFVREGMTEDLPYARKVADHLDVDLHTVYVGPEMIDHLETMIYHLDEPQADPAPLNVYFISKLARENGIKVLLSGVGGDDILAGYRRHFALSMESMWSWLPGAVRTVISNGVGILPKELPIFRRLSKMFQYAGYDGNERLSSYFLWNSPPATNSLFNRDVKEGLCDREVFAPLIRSLEKLPVETSPLNKMLYLEGKHFLADHNLQYTDKMSMATGVEVRVPLLDPDLIRLAASLPVHYKQRGRTGKWVLKKAMENYLPHDVIYRGKTGFGAPLRHWLKDDLKPLVEEVLSERSLKARGLFDPENVRIFREMDARGRIDGAYTIFALLCIEIWCRQFIDQTVPSS